MEAGSHSDILGVRLQVQPAAKRPGGVLERGRIWGDLTPAPTTHRDLGSPSHSQSRGVDAPGCSLGIGVGYFPREGTLMAAG